MINTVYYGLKSTMESPVTKGHAPGFLCMSSPAGSTYGTLKLGLGKADPDSSAKRLA